MKVLGNKERLKKELTAPRGCKAGFQGQSPSDAALISRSGQGGALRASPTALCGLGEFALGKEERVEQLFNFHHPSRIPEGRGGTWNLNPLSTFKTRAFPNAKPPLLCKMNCSVNISRGCFPPPPFFFSLLELITCATETEKAKF